MLRNDSLKPKSFNLVVLLGPSSSVISTPDVKRRKDVLEFIYLNWSLVYGVSPTLPNIFCLASTCLFTQGANDSPTNVDVLPIT